MRSVFYHFGPFQVDVGRRLLSRDGQPSQLSPKVFDTLLELIGHAGEVITKEQLLAAVWPDAAVEENSLARNVSSLRKALGESASDHQYVMTIPGRGYSFVAPVRRTDGLEVPLEQASPQPVDRPVRFWNRKVVLPAVLILVAAGVLGTSHFRKSEPPPFEHTRIIRITSSGKALKAVISPDSRYIAFTTLASGNQALVVRRTTTLHEVEIVPPAPVRYAGITFSPDNEMVYYVLWKPGQKASALYRVPVMGGSSERLKENVDSPVTFSPDGKSFAFMRESFNQSTVFVAAVDSGAERKLASRTLPQVLDYPAWSPDGRTIAATTYDSSSQKSTGSDARIILIQSADGRERALSDHMWGFVRQTAWRLAICVVSS